MYTQQTSKLYLTNPSWKLPNDIDGLLKKKMEIGPIVQTVCMNEYHNAHDILSYAFGIHFWRKEGSKHEKNQQKEKNKKFIISYYTLQWLYNGWGGDITVFTFISVHRNIVYQSKEPLLPFFGIQYNVTVRSTEWKKRQTDTQ